LALCCGLLLTAAYLPGLSQILKLVRPAPFEWGLILICSLVPLAVGQMAIGVLGRRRKGKKTNKK
jgi:Ca2+-transporting ATPase